MPHTTLIKCIIDHTMYLRFSVCRKAREVAIVLVPFLREIVRHASSYDKQEMHISEKKGAKQ